jgi:hypothetical protein
MPKGVRLGVLGLSILGAVLPALAVARAPRLVEFHVTATGTQTTSWSASGARAWCPNDPTLTVPYGGSGSAAIHVSGATTFPLAVGAKPSLSLALEASLEHTGSFVEHDGAVTSRPVECPPLPEVDTPAATNECGHSTASLSAAISARGQPTARLLAPSTSSPPLGCPSITSVLVNAGGEAPTSHPETKDGLIPVSFPGLLAPATAPTAPSPVVGHASSSWQAPLPGGTLSVNTTSEVQASISPAPMIAPGRGIANIHIGETFAALRRASKRLGGFSVPDSGLLDSNGQHWIWIVEVPVPELELHGGNIREGVSVSIPSGHHSGNLRPGGPPDGARVAQVYTTGTYEVTPAGAGKGMTLSALRKAEPHGHTILFFGRPIDWAVDGPGRRRTAFTLLGGIVQSVEVGCGQSDRGAPVSDSHVC